MQLRRVCIGSLAAISLAAIALAGTKRISGTVVGADGKELANAEVSASWSLVKGAFEAKDKLKTDRTGRFSGEVEVPDGKVLLMAMDKDRKSGALLVATPEQLAKPLKLQVRPLIAVSGSLDLSEFGSDAPGEAEVVVSIDGVQFFADKVKGGKLSYRLPAALYDMEVSVANGEALDEPFELAADTQKHDLGKLKLRPSRDFAKAQAGKAPKITVSDVINTSKSIKLEDYKGKWVFLEFWAHW